MVEQIGLKIKNKNKTSFSKIKYDFVNFLK
jgi:hypothetical protein